MSIEYDEKGKFYTDVVKKISVPSILQTTTHLIRGYVYIKQGERLKDGLETDESFMAVTDARVYDKDENIVFNGPFLVVRKDQIVWMMPVDEDGKKGTEG